MRGTNEDKMTLHYRVPDQLTIYFANFCHAQYNPFVLQGSALPQNKLNCLVSMQGSQ